MANSDLKSYDRSSPEFRSYPSNGRQQFRPPREKEKDRSGGVPVTFRYRYIPNSSPEETECDGMKWTELVGLGAACGSADVCNIH